MLSPAEPQLFAKDTIGIRHLHQFRLQTRLAFAKLLALILQTERTADYARRQLTQTPLSVFQQLDTARQGFLQPKNFERVLAAAGFRTRSADLDSLMSRFDKNQDGRVTYSEFLEEITV